MNIVTKAMADLGVRDGIQVNAVNPGAIRTERLARRLAQKRRRRESILAAASASTRMEVNPRRRSDLIDYFNALRIVKTIPKAAGKGLTSQLRL